LLNWQEGWGGAGLASKCVPRIGRGYPVFVPGENGNKKPVNLNLQVFGLLFGLLGGEYDN
jgi:hypothetical protein